MANRNKSIVQDDMSRCLICGSANKLQTHEVFCGSANRQKSIDWGCYVRLCAFHHNASNNCVHYNHAMDMNLKKFAQRKFEEKYGHEKFMEVFGKSYL